MSLKDELKTLVTESQNPESSRLDELSTSEIVGLMNKNDQTVAKSVALASQQISKAIGLITESFRNKGRLIYIGAGTSGRLGVLDAAECVPTFGTDPEQVQGIIAGGHVAMTEAVEGAEDSTSLPIVDLKRIKLSKLDTVVGLSASGRTPYVVSGLQYAKEVGSNTVSVACNNDAITGKNTDVSIEVVVGPEVLSGSTRLKAGTAQKMVLNMLSTASMIKIGKAFGNLMVDVKATNEKLVERSKRIIMLATGMDYKEAEKYYLSSNGEPKAAIVMYLAHVTYEDAQHRLSAAQGKVRDALLVNEDK